MVNIYVADPSIRQEQLEAIRSYLPSGWLLGERREDATAILTKNVDVTIVFREVQAGTIDSSATENSP